MSHLLDGSVPAAEALCALARKYRTLGDLRRARARGEPLPPRSVFRQLAREFPGALRELDTVELAELDARAVSLECAAHDPTAWAPWMALLHGYHCWMRAALWLKPRLARLGAVSLQTREQLAAGAAAHAGATVDPAFVEQVAAPPGGRLRGIVLARVASVHGVCIEDVMHAALLD